MIAYLSGKIILKKENFIILDVNGIGYEVFLSSVAKIPEKGSELNLFCHLDLTERAVKLYGFSTFEELEAFKIVRSISGVGPKAALEISALGSLEQIKDKIEKGNLKIPGIGKKKAQKISLELSGRIKHAPEVKGEAFDALMALGFPKEKVKKALSEIEQGISEQEKIKQALKILQ